MEGYTNVVGTSYNFDDLDIEGRVDERSADNNKKNSSNFQGRQGADEGSILKQRVKVEDGKEADVFSLVKKQEHVWYTCHVCSDTMVGLPSLRQHVETNKHWTNMAKPYHPMAKFAKVDPNENISLEPGEPVPPGLEEKIIKTCEIQPRLDEFKTPLIGLEFLVELTDCPMDEIIYYCLLCDKTGYERNIFIHLSSMLHYMKYLSVYFPTVARKLMALPNKKLKKSFSLLVVEIIGDIEAKYGRMRPISEKHADFYGPTGRKDQLAKMINAGPHIEEKPGVRFDEKATAENVDKKCEELMKAPPQTGRPEGMEANNQNLEAATSMFNKNTRINIKQLRAREEKNSSKSPDVEFVGVQMVKSPGKKKRSRSKSLSSISSAGSSRSGSRPVRHRYNRNHSRNRQRWSWSRSRSRSPSRYSHRRPSPPSHGHRGRSPPRHRYHRRSRSPDHRYRDRVDRYGRTRNGSRDRDRDRDRDYRSHRDSREKHSREQRGMPKDVVVSASEKNRWAKYREELSQIEATKLEKLKFHEKNPEQHPQYPEEWKAFWNRRYNELQRSGVDPSKHDFKPEWISFWTKRMKELYEEDLGKAKQELREKFELPEEFNVESEPTMPWESRKRRNTSPGLVDVSPPTPEKKDVIADIKTTWKAFTGSDIKDAPKRPLSPWEEDGNQPMNRNFRAHSPSITDKILEEMPQRKARTSSLIFVLRKLTVLEQQLGSLAPKVFELMSLSLAREKIQEDASLDLLHDHENCVFLETVREKLIALLCAGVVPKNFVNTARSAIKHIDISLYLASKRPKYMPIEAMRSNMGFPPPYSNPNVYSVPEPKPEPVVVPGVGHIDRVAIASQIATALVEQGRTNVTEAELAQLVNAVVGMAEASANTAQPMTAANYLHQLQSMSNPAPQSAPTPPIFPAASTMSQFTGAPPNTAPVQSSTQPQERLGALTLLQSAYDDPAKQEQDSPKEDSPKPEPKPKVVSDEELAAALARYNKTPKEGQSAFLDSLQMTNPELLKRLRLFIPAVVHDDPETTKRSPITISLNKERSEQKIKPVASGRLSPFSSRSGGVNPTVGERVVIDDDEDVTIVPDSPSTGKVSKELSNDSKTKNTSRYNYGFDDDDVGGDDDDDDYSFEDVYKAAQEKLRQRDINEQSAKITKPTNEEIRKENTDKIVLIDDNHKNIVNMGAAKENNTHYDNSVPSRNEETEAENKNKQAGFQQVESNYGKALPYPGQSNIRDPGSQSNFQDTPRNQQGSMAVDPEQFDIAGPQHNYPAREQYPSQDLMSNDPYKNIPRDSSYNPNYNQGSLYAKENDQRPPYENYAQQPYPDTKSSYGYPSNNYSGYNPPYNPGRSDQTYSGYDRDQYGYKNPAPQDQGYPQTRPYFQSEYSKYPAPNQRYQGTGYPPY